MTFQNAPSRATAGLQPAHTHRLNHAFRIKHHHGLNSSSVTTTFYRLMPSRHHTIETIFIAIGGPITAHSNTTVQAGPAYGGSIG
jgi:hypothetical protein